MQCMRMAASPFLCSDVDHRVCMATDNRIAKMIRTRNAVSVASWSDSMHRQAVLPYNDGMNFDP